MTHISTSWTAAWHVATKPGDILACFGQNSPVTVIERTPHAVWLGVKQGRVIRACTQTKPSGGFHWVNPLKNPPQKTHPNLIRLYFLAPLIMKCIITIKFLKL